MFASLQSQDSSPIGAYLSKLRRVATAVSCLTLLGAAGFFIHKHALHYFLEWTEDSFGPWWERRGQLVVHVGAGTVAVLSGPLQLWSGLRRRYRQLHRWIGRAYLVAVVIGASFSMYLAATTLFGFVWAVALFVAATFWLGATAMAYVAIRKGLVALHVEWMIRAYVMTFAFVMYRLLNEYGPMSELEPAHDRGITNVWLSWVAPMIIVEVVLGLRRISCSRREQHHNNAQRANSVLED